MILNKDEAGFTLLEVLVSIIIFSFGLLGIASLQVTMQTSHVEGYQRSQAVLLLRDIAERLNANINSAADYVTGTATPVGYGDNLAEDCDDPALSEADRDMCEWSLKLKGASELRDGTRTGAMIGARGCIEELIAADPTAGVCAPGVYRVSLVWQGMRASRAPAEGLACGKDQFGDEGLRRIVTSTVTVGLPRCS